MKKIIVLVFLILNTAGCSNTVWVREQKAVEGKETTYEQIGGIPFYAKKSIFNQTTIYAKTWLNATITVERSFLSEKDGKIESQLIDNKSYDKVIAKSNMKELDAIKVEIINSDVKDEATARDIVKKFTAIANFKDFDSVIPEQIGNSIKEELVTDYSKKYYLNAPLPWFGTGSLTQDLNADGTLSKVESKPDTKLAEGIASLVPINEFLSAKYVNPLNLKNDQKYKQFLGEIDLANQNRMMMFQSQIEFGHPNTAAVQLPKPEEKWWKDVSQINYKVTLSIIEKGYVYKFAKNHDDGEFKAPITFDTSKGFYTRETLGEKPSSAPSEDKEKDKSKSIGLSGTIKFPDNWGK